MVSDISTSSFEIEPVQGTVYHGDGREEALLKHLQSHPDLQNNPGTQPVLDAIHEFGKGENRYLMNVGDTKGKGIEKLIQDKKPKVSSKAPKFAFI